jgi:hypothetical protein
MLVLHSVQISVKKMYTSLFAYLNEKGILPSGPSCIVKSPAPTDRVADRIFELIHEDLERQAKVGSVPGEFRCGVEQESLLKRGYGDADLVVRKLVSMSTTSFIHCGAISRYSGDVHDGYSASWDAFGQFLSLIFRYRQAVESNLVIPTVSYSFVESIGDLSDETVTHANFGRDSLNVNLEIGEIDRQFLETERPAHEVPVGTVDILLPHLKNVSLETIVRLRVNEQESFIRYHRCLSKFFHDASKVTNEQGILDCLLQIDQGIRESEASFNVMRKKNLYSGLGLAVGLSSAVLCLFLPHELAEYIRAVIGGATGVAAFKYLAAQQDSAAEIRKSAFYFPWLLHQNSK